MDTSSDVQNTAPPQTAVTASARGGTHSGLSQMLLTHGTIKQKYSTEGAIVTLEQGDTTTGGPTNECCYLTHGTATDHVREVFALALCRYMAKRFGMDFTKRSDIVLGEWRTGSVTNLTDAASLVIFYRNSPTETVEAHGISITGDNTWTQVAANIINNILATWDDNNEPQLLSASWYALNGTQRNLVAECDLFSCDVSFAMVSKINLQNATAGSAETDTEATSVANNPLNLKYYYLNGTNVAPRFIQDPSGTVYTGPNKASGYSYLTWDSTSWPADATANLRRPPNKQFWQTCDSTGKLVIQPGGVLQSIIKREQTMRMDKFLETCSKAVFPSFAEKTTVGSTQILAFDKQIRATPTGVPIKVDFELQQTYMCKIKYHKNRKWITQVII